MKLTESVEKKQVGKFQISKLGLEGGLSPKRVIGLKGSGIVSKLAEGKEEETEEAQRRTVEREEDRMTLMKREKLTSERRV